MLGVVIKNCCDLTEIEMKNETTKMNCRNHEQKKVRNPDGEWGRKMWSKCQIPSRNDEKGMWFYRKTIAEMKKTRGVLEIR